MNKKNISYTQTVLAFLLLLPQVKSHAADMIFFDFDKELAASQVSTVADVSSIHKLVDLINNELKQRSVDKELTDSANEIQMHFDKYLSNRLSAVENKSKVEIESIDRELRSILYSVRAAFTTPKGESFLYLISKLKNVIAGQIYFPYLSPLERLQPLSLDKLNLESFPLVDKSNKVYESRAAMSGLSSQKISELDVLETDSMWYSEKTLSEIKKKFGTAWSYLEDKIEKEISQEIGQQYSIQQARKVLFFKKIKSSATSAKIEVKDAYGQKWKIKWGEEVQSEIVTNRLYANLGAKFSDLVYSDTFGEKNLILVLDEKDDSCDSVASVANLKQCLLNSVYQFNLSGYIADSGKIDQKFISRNKEQFSHVSKEKIDEIIGRTYVTFVESSINLQVETKNVLRLGAVPFSLAKSIENRVKRGLVVFSYWIRNKDAKDDNNRGLLDQSEYKEYIHDLGASLAGMRSAYNPNQLLPQFIFKAVNPQTKEMSLKYDMGVLYKPAAFTSSTFSDQLWMARKIVNLSENDIRSVVAATGLPSFAVEAMSNRLILRKNNIAEAYDLGSVVSKVADHKVYVNLNTREDRLSFVRKYKLDAKFKNNEARALEYVEKSMQAAGVKIDDSGLSGYQDLVSVYSNGMARLQKCNNSVVISMLEETVHPTGLSRRVNRHKDEVPLKSCPTNQEFMQEK